jgi:hypothetical protein
MGTATGDEVPEIFIKLGAPMAQEKLSERTLKDNSNSCEKLKMAKFWQNGPPF